MITNIVAALVMATSVSDTMFPCSCRFEQVWGYSYKYTNDNVIIDVQEIPGDWYIVQQHHGKRSEGTEYAVLYPSYAVSTKTNVNDVINSKIKELTNHCSCKGEWWFSTNYIGRIEIFESTRFAECGTCGRVGRIIDREVRPRWDFLHGGK